MQVEIRDASNRDARALVAIYAPLVRETAVSFELEPPDAEELARRVEHAQSRWAFLVAEAEGAVVAYAYGGELRGRPAYAWSVETSIYVDASRRGRGLGAQLYPALLARLCERGFRNAYAGIALPNPASVALHHSVGFEHIGVFPRVGYKLGAWRDVAWMHRALGTVAVEQAPEGKPEGTPR